MSNAAKLAQLPQPLKQSVHGCSPSFFLGLYKEDERLEEAKNNCAVWEHRKGIVGSSVLLCGAAARAVDRGVLGKAEHKEDSVPQLPCTGSSQGNPFPALFLGIVGDLHTTHLEFGLLDAF